MLDTPFGMAIFIIGLIASALTIICWIPQVIKVAKTKNTVSLSLMFQLILLIGIIVWLLYAILLLVQAPVNNIPGAVPILITNSIVFVLCSYTIIMKLTNISKAKKMNLTEEQYMKQLEAK